METDVLPIIYMLDISLLVLLVSDQRNNPFPCNVQIRGFLELIISKVLWASHDYFLCAISVYGCVCAHAIFK